MIAQVLPRVWLWPEMRSKNRWKHNRARGGTGQAGPTDPIHPLIDFRDDRNSLPLAGAIGLSMSVEGDIELWRIGSVNIGPHRANMQFCSKIELCNRRWT